MLTLCFFSPVEMKTKSWFFGLTPAEGTETDVVPAIFAYYVKLA